MIGRLIAAALFAILPYSHTTNAMASYCADMKITGFASAEFPGRTRDGTRTIGNEWAIAAVDPSVIPLQSTVSIPELGLTLRAADTGGGVIGAHVDVLTRTRAEAFALTGRYLVCINV